MARYCGGDNPEYLFQSISYWKAKCLIGQRSVFTNKSIWNKRAAQQLARRLEDAPVLGGSKDFYEKLEWQLGPLSKSCSILAAEMLWLLSLYTHNVGAEEKRKSICFVYQLSGEKLTEKHAYLSDDILKGIASTGRAYSQYRWRELKYLANLMAKYFDEPKDARSSLVADHKRFALWLEKIDDNENRQFRHMLLFGLFPDQHERIFSRTHRVRVLSQLGLNELSFSQVSAQLIDEELLAVRRYYEDYYNTEELDFYVKPLADHWDQKKDVANNTKKSKNSGVPTGKINPESCWDTPPKLTKKSKSAFVFESRGKYKADRNQEGRNKRLGRQGEKFVLDFEKQRLKDAGYSEEADQVKWVSEEEGDGEGYDIESFDEIKKTKIFIEVKTTRHGKNTPFFMSPNELARSKTEQDKYVLYRVFNFGDNPKLYKLEGDIEQQVHFEPTGYKLSF